jgi:four helix bundle protein
MSPVESYKDLQVWQRAIQMTVALYKLTRTFPAEELYTLTSQLRRAGISVASNIAEGYGRSSTGEYKHFLGMARGSNLEVQTQLVIAKELGLGNLPLLIQADALSQEISKMLNSLIQKL